MSPLSPYLEKKHTTQMPYHLSNVHCSRLSHKMWGNRREKARLQIEAPLMPGGQESPSALRYLRGEEIPLIQSIKIPKATYKKMYRLGDWAELREYYFVNNSPAYFRYDYQPPLSNIEIDEEGGEAVIGEEKAHLRIKEISPEEREQNRERSRRRAKNNVRMLCQKNRLSMMWTLTFALPPKCEADADHHRSFGVWRHLDSDAQRDRGEVLRAWNLALTSIRKKLKGRKIPFKWVKVLEKHDSEESSPEKRGTYHIHIATDLRFPKRKLQRMWGFGEIYFTDFLKDDWQTYRRDENSPVIRARDASGYMTKYLSKDFEEAERLGERSWTKSQNMKVPTPERDLGVIQHRIECPLNAFDLEGMKREHILRLEESRNLFDFLVPEKSGEFPITIRIKGDSGEIEEKAGYVRIYFFCVLKC
jgi:hypothetical protein